MPTAVDGLSRGCRGGPQHAKISTVTRE
jgi:hypothetical protein